MEFLFFRRDQSVEKQTDCKAFRHSIERYVLSCWRYVLLEQVPRITVYEHGAKMRIVVLAKQHEEIREFR